VILSANAEQKLSLKSVSVDLPFGISSDERSQSFWRASPAMTVRLSTSTITPGHQARSAF